MSDAKKLRKTLQTLFDSQPDDQRLRDHLEGVRMDEAFSGLTWFWGPILYERNRVIFRPFILNHFSEWELVSSWRWSRIKWKDHEEALEVWLKGARQNRDTHLVRKLLSWKYAGGKWGLDQKRWNNALIISYKTAKTAAARAIVLDEFDTWFTLDEDTALELYETDSSSKKFIEKHLPSSYWDDKKRSMWQRLGQRVLEAGDTKFYFKIYRSLIPIKQWKIDVEDLSNRISDVGKLNDELQQRHPSGWGLKVEGPLLSLLEKKGKDVFPYIRSKLEDVFGGWYNSQSDKLIALAKDKGWWDLHAAAIQVASDKKYFNQAVKDLLDNDKLDETIRIERLKALAGVSREWNWPGFGLARVHSLDDQLARKLYLQYPKLIKGPFLTNVTPRWWNSSKELLSAALEQDDDELIDTLSARYVMYSYYSYYGSKNDNGKELDRLAEYYQNIREKDKKIYARRASNVLTRVPAYATYNFNQLVKSNILARLLFVRSFDAYLTVPSAVQDLVEGSNIHVQKLAYRILAQDDPRAQKLAAENIDVLIGTLLRPIHRATRMPAFSALANAAQQNIEIAEKIHHKAREAIKLPDKKYPKEELFGLIGRILSTHPELCLEEEQLVIYRKEERVA